MKRPPGCDLAPAVVFGLVSLLVLFALTAIFRANDRLHIFLLVLVSGMCGNIAAVVVDRRNRKR